MHGPELEGRTINVSKVTVECTAVIDGEKGVKISKQLPMKRFRPCWPQNHSVVSYFGMYQEQLFTGGLHMRSLQIYASLALAHQTAISGTF
jgi:hypothetical protein